MTDFQESVLAAAQASGMLPAADAADADPAASEFEPEDAASPEIALADDDAEDDADLDGEDADEDDADDPDSPSDREAELLRQLEELRAQQTRYEAERLAAEQERQRLEWAQAEQNLDGWLRRSLSQLAHDKANDERLIAASDDPQALRAHLGALRQQTDNWIWGQYRQQKQVYDQHKHAAVMTALAQTQIREWAEQTAQRYGLPKNAAPQLMQYADGTPVHPDAMPARAAELADQRKRERAYQRQLSQAKRSTKAAELRTATGTAPGSGQPQGVPEFKSWRDQLQWAADQYGLH